METLNFLFPRQGNATKVFRFEDGSWKLQSAYKAGKWLKAYQIRVESLEEAHEILMKARESACFLIHGAFKKGVDLDKLIVRRKKINPNEPDVLPTIEDREIKLLCLDVDGYDKNKELSPEIQIERFIESELPKPFHSADYTYQLSASYGLATEKLKCHLFFWLEKPLLSTLIQAWIKKFNQAKEWGNVLDPSILTCTQPIYTQRRICEKAHDPVKKDMGLVTKSGDLIFDFAIKAEPPTTKESKPLSKKYDISEGVRQILTADNFHDEINRLALSLLNKKLAPKTVRDLIEGAMTAAKANIADNARLQEWQIRFDDIGRSVQSAAEIVAKPTIEELEAWIVDSTAKEVKNNFAPKALALSPLDLKAFIDAIELKLGVGVQNIKDTIRIAKKEKEAEEELKKRAKKTAARKRKGVSEVIVTLSNTEEVCEAVSGLLANSKNGDGVFKTPLGLVKVACDFPKTIRQVMKRFELNEDYPKMPVLQYYRAVTLGARIENDVAFMNSKGKDIPCPTNILKILEEGVSDKFKPLSGIIEHPFVNRKFQVIQKNGYDDHTGLFSMLHHKLKLKTIPPKKAFDYLAHTVFDEFPFASELDRCVAVAALMTCVQRPIIAGDSGFPGFGITSPVQSSGKTTLAQLISYSIYNRAVAATSFSKDDTELRKHILAILKEGHSCILFDNMPAGMEVTSNELAKAMSSDTYAGRLLGDTKTVEAPSLVVWLFTGNSIYFVGDFGTRVYPINLDPRMENPDTRYFRRTDIGQWAMDNRKHILSAVISLIMHAKKEIKMPGASRFPVWDRFVRQPLFSIAGMDINDAIKDNKQNDTYLQAKISFLRLLKKEFGELKEFSSGDISKAAVSEFDGQVYGELGEALTDLLDNRAKNTKSIGKLLSRLKNVVLNGLVLKPGSARKWFIEKT